MEFLQWYAGDEVQSKSTLAPLTPDPGEPQYTSETYPYDLDTTSLGLLTHPQKPELVHSILDEMHDYIDEDGNAEVRILDNVVCPNSEIHIKRSRSTSTNQGRGRTPSSV